MATTAHEALSVRLAPHADVRLQPSLATLGVDSEDAPVLPNPSAYVEAAVLDRDSRLAVDLDLQREGESVCAEGARVIRMLYSHRSAASLMPVVTSETEAERDEIKRVALEVMEAHMEELNQLATYTSTLVAYLDKAFSQLAPNKHRVVGDELLDAVGTIFGHVFVIDRIKELRSSLKEELTRFKRATGTSSAAYTSLQMLLAVTTVTSEICKPAVDVTGATGVKQCPHYKHVLCMLLNRAVDRWTHKEFATPADRHGTLHSIVQLFYILDEDCGADPKKKASAFNNPDAPRSAIFDIIRHNPVVPVFADVSVALLSVITTFPSYDDDFGAQCFGTEGTHARALRAMHLEVHWEGMRSRHAEVTHRLSGMLLALSGELKRCGGDSTKVPAELTAEAANVAAESLALLTDLSSRILEQSAVKHSNVAPSPPGVEASFYERAVQYNHSVAERSVLVDAISMVKALAGQLLRAEAMLAPVLRVHIYNDIQHIVHTVLTNQLEKAKRQKKTVIEDRLLLARNAVAVWRGSCENERKYIERGKGKKVKGLPADEEAEPRVVGPTRTQLLVLRTAVKGLIDAESELMERHRSGLSLSKSAFLIPKKRDLLQAFYRRLFTHGALMNFGASVAAASNLGQLWYRELFIDRCRRVQFPIETSMPWMLIKHTLEQGADVNLLSVYHVFDLYNDAAHIALRSLSRQHLYDEVEAELNLAFVDFTYTLSMLVYNEAKDAAAAAELPAAFRERFDVAARTIAAKEARKSGSRRWRQAGAGASITPAHSWSHLAVTQRDVGLLSRSVNVQAIVSKSVSETLAAEVEKAIGVFEGDDDGLCALPVLELTLDTLKGTHRKLSEHLTLEPYDVMLDRALKPRGPLSPLNRLSVYMLDVLVTDFIPAFAFCETTHRFVRCPSSAAKPRRVTGSSRSTKKVPLVGTRCAKAAGTATMLYRGYFGQEHAACFVRLLGHTGVSFLFEHLMSNACEKVTDDLALYFPKLVEGFRPIPFPKFQYGSPNVYEAYIKTCSEMLQYDDLRPEVFQALREVGNTLCFFKLIDDALQHHDQATHVAITPILNASGIQAASTGESAPGTHSADLLLGAGTLAADLDTPVDLLQTALERLTVALNTKDPDTGVAIVYMFTGGDEQPPGSDCHVESLENVSTGNEHTWHRLWSSLLFAYCMPMESDDGAGNAVTDVQEFGDGFLWGGCVLTFLLGQTRRFLLSDPTTHVLQAVEYEAAGHDVFDADSSDTLPPPTLPSVYARRLHAAVPMFRALKDALKEFVAAKDTFVVAATPSMERIGQIFAQLATHAPKALGEYPVDPAGSLCAGVEFVPPEDDDDFACPGMASFDPARPSSGVPLGRVAVACGAGAGAGAAPS